MIVSDRLVEDPEEDHDGGAEGAEADLLPDPSAIAAVILEHIETMIALADAAALPEDVQSKLRVARAEALSILRNAPGGPECGTRH